MPRLLFWNTHGKDLSGVIADICVQKSVDICILCESPVDGHIKVLTALNRLSPRPYHRPHNLSPRLEFFVAFTPGSMIPLSDSNTVAIRRVRHPLGIDINLIAVHLPSQLAYDDVEQALFSSRVCSEIRENLLRHGELPTIMVGDFNMDPFHPGIRNSEGFHGVMDRALAKQGSRTVQGLERRFLYNPMWSYLGDMSPGPPGTYFYRGSTPNEIFWHTYDQILISPDLIDCLDRDGVQVLTQHGQTELTNALARPDSDKYSDHFPLFCEIKLERRLAQ